MAVTGFDGDSGSADEHEALGVEVGSLFQPDQVVGLEQRPERSAQLGNQRVVTSTDAAPPSASDSQARGAARDTIALLLEVDPIGLARGRSVGPSLREYVNDRPYVAWSFLSIALRAVFGSALAGTARDRPRPRRSAPADDRPRRGHPARAFAPLGYERATSRPLDPAFPGMRINSASPRCREHREASGAYSGRR